MGGEQLRPGLIDNRDVRELRLRVLGPFEVERVEAHRLGSRKARTLCKVLALARGRPVSVDRLVDCVWPERSPARPGVDVAVLVSRLRSVLGAERLERSDAGYSLAVDWLDLAALEAMAAEAARRLSDGRWAGARAAAAAALALDRGPLLADEPDAPWVEVDRVAAARLLAQARHTAARAALASGDAPAAAGLAEGLLDHDPYDEAALRTLMAAHAAAGRPASALAVYARTRLRLAEDLGVDPAPATEAVHTAILREEPVPGVAAAPAAPPPERDPPGRSRELAGLEAALDRAAGGLTMVSLQGEAGMGKTHLLSVFAGRARAAGATVLAGCCDELDRALPLEAVADALSRHLRAAGSEAAERLLAPGAAALAPILAPSGPGGVGAATVAALPDPSTGRAVLFGALTGLFQRVAGTGRVALLLDDAHQAGAATLEWLRFVSHRTPELPMLVVAAQRTEEALALPESTTLTLGPLDLAAVREVVGPERADDLLAWSGGVPLFLVELAAAGPGEVLPDSVREWVAGRVERTGPAAITLRTAAVIGPDIDVDLLAAVLRLAPVELLDHLDEGVRHRFLVESESGFAFRHALVREALATGTGAARRALAHREAGRALAARAKADPLRVAYHARLGGDDERAAVALTEAARLAAERYDLADAERRLDQALALADGPPVRLARARVRILREDFSGAAADATAALGQGGGAEALEVAGWAAHHQRDFTAAIRLASDGASLASEPALRASCLGLGGYARTMSGDLAGAEAALEEALRQAPGANRVACAGWLGMLRVYQGRAEEGLDLLRPATLPGAPAAGFSGLRARQQAAYALALLGRPAEALAAFDDLEAETARRQVERYTGSFENFRGWILRQLGAHGEADEANHRGLAAAARLAATQPRVHVEQRAHGLLDLADGCLQEGDPGDARRLLAQLGELQEVEHGLRWRHELRARLLAGRLALAEEDWEEGQAAAADLVEESGRLGIARYLAAGRILEGQARAGAGETLDVDGLGHVLESLPDLAGLEAWWLTAQVAVAAGVDAWWGLAERRVARLAGQAGERGDGLRRYAAARLEAMRAGGR